MKTPIRLRSHLLINYLIILLLGMSLAALLAWRSVESQYLETQRENLLAQANLVAETLQGQALPDGISQPYTQTSNVLPGIHTRLLSEQGALIYSLPVSVENLQVPAVENSIPISPQELQSRPEISRAMQGNPSTIIRKVTGRRVLYAAAPVLGNDGTITGIVYLAMPLPPAGLPVNLILELVGAVLSAAIFAMIAGSWLADRIVSPVEEIARAATEVSAGNLNQQVPQTTRIKELNELGRTFNLMTDNLRHADQVKKSFIADVTHELRTPLTVIKGTIETLEDGALDDIGGRGALLKSMQRETERLIRLVNDLLVLTRASAGTLNMEIQPLDLAELARERCLHFSPLSARSRVQVVVTGLDSAWVLGDFDRVSQVLDNLLDNAIRYSPTDSAITIEIGASDEECHCAVRDCGTGIPENHLPFIFDRFYRVDSSRDRQTGGAGLGLAIARALILAQSGNISVESQVGKGTTIQFSLPAVELPSS